MKKVTLMLVALLVSVGTLSVQAEASPIISGSTYFASTVWTADVYWEVYAPFDSPLDSIADYSYLYQINNLPGSDPISQLSVGNPFKVAIASTGYNTSNNLGGLTGTFAPTTTAVGIASTYFNFDPSPGGGELLGGTTSYLLYLTSPRPPFLVSSSLQGSAASNVQSLPGPVPEPTSMLLLGVGLIGLAGARKKFIA